MVQKSDGVFDQGFFFNEIKDQTTKLNLLIGSHPKTVTDIRNLLQHHKVDCVLSIQTDQDIVDSGIDEQDLRNIYKSKGVQYLRCPVNDSSTENSY